MDLVYPVQEDLDKIVEILLRIKPEFVPPVDNAWSQEMYNMFCLVQMLPGCKEDFAIAAANLFFKVAKNHRRFDGNKRSAICCLILFIIINNHSNDISNEEIEKLALDTAASQGNSGNTLIPKMSDFFKEKLKPF